MQEIKLIDAPSQTFSTKLGDKNVAFKIQYNTRSERWSFNLFIETKLVLSGRKIVTGINLLKNFTQIDLGLLFAIDITKQGLLPNRNNMLDGNIKFMFVSDAEILELKNDDQSIS